MAQTTTEEHYGLSAITMGMVDFLLTPRYTPFCGHHSEYIGVKIQRGHDKGPPPITTYSPPGYSLLAPEWHPVGNFVSGEDLGQGLGRLLREGH